MKVFLAVRNRFLFVFYLSWSQVCILPDCLKKLFVKCNSKSSKNVNEKIYFDFWRAPWFSLWITIQNFFHICESWFGGITTAGNILYVKILFCFSLRLRNQLNFHRDLTWWKDDLIIKRYFFFSFTPLCLNVDCLSRAS